MKNIARLVSGVAAALALTACTAGQTPGPSLSSVNPLDPNYSKLQFAVGTANLYGTSTGLNVVSTLRQPNGHSAVGVDSPTITGPFTITAGAAPANGSLSDPYTTITTGGPSLAESGSNPVSIGSTPQSVHPGTPFCDTIGTVAGFTTCPSGISPNASTFGESGGVFAMGLAPYNARAETAQSYSYAPYAQPFYAQNNRVFVPWGGPPAFDPDANGMGTRDGLVVSDIDSFNQPYFLGVGEGLSAFQGVTPGAGAYSLTVQICTAAAGGGSCGNLSANASLTSVAPLATISSPTVVPDGSGDGGATLNVVLPAGVTEGLVQIVDYGPGGGPLNGGGSVGNCHGPKGEAFSPVYYTIHVTASGAYALPPSDGPNINLNGGKNNLTPSHSICTLLDNQAPPDGVTPQNAGDNFTVEMIGFDYPAYEAAVSLIGSSVPQAPPITGAGGQADLTLAVPVEEDYPGYAPTPLLRIGHQSVRYRHPHPRSTLKSADTPSSR